MNDWFIHRYIDVISLICNISTYLFHIDHFATRNEWQRGVKNREAHLGRSIKSLQLGRIISSRRSSSRYAENRSALACGISRRPLVISRRFTTVIAFGASRRAAYQNNGGGRARFCSVLSNYRHRRKRRRRGRLKGSDANKLAALRTASLRATAFERDLSRARRSRFRLIARAPPTFIW